MVARHDVWLARLDLTEGAEIRKTRPVVVVSPDQTNRYLRTVIACPLTSTRKGWPTRTAVEFGGRQGEIAGDQIRSLDKSRLIKRLGSVTADEAARLTGVLAQILG